MHRWLCDWCGFVVYTNFSLTCMVWLLYWNFEISMHDSLLFYLQHSSFWTHIYSLFFFFLLSSNSSLLWCPDIACILYMEHMYQIDVDPLLFKVSGYHSISALFLSTHAYSVHSLCSKTFFSFNQIFPRGHQLSTAWVWKMWCDIETRSRSRRC